MNKKVKDLVYIYDNTKVFKKKNLNYRDTIDSYTTDIANVTPRTTIYDGDSDISLAFSDYSYNEEIADKYIDANTPVNNNSNIKVLDYINTTQYNSYCDDISMDNSSIIPITPPITSYNLNKRETYNSLNDSQISEIELSFEQKNDSEDKKPYNNINKIYIIHFLLMYLYILFMNLISTQFILNTNLIYTNWTFISICYGLILFVLTNMNHIEIEYLQFNPILTIILYLFGKIDIINIISFSLIQFVTSFLSNLTIYGLYYDQIDNINDDITLGKIFSSQKNETASIGSSIFLILFITIIYSICYFYVLHLNETKYRKSIILSVCFTVLFAIFGYDVGYCINSIHILSSNIFILILFNKQNIFSINVYWGTISLFIPFIGFLVGKLIYKYIIK